ncbi:MAG: hypothetical protein JSV76_06760, partial [Candidatus Bathyarchaeota archaeon]
VQDTSYRANLHKILAIADTYDMNVIFVGAKYISGGTWNVWFYGQYVHSSIRDVIPSRSALLSTYASKWLEFTEDNFFLEIYNEPMLGEVSLDGVQERYFHRNDNDALDHQQIWYEDCQNIITYLQERGFTAPIILHWGHGTISPLNQPYNYLWNMNWYKRFDFEGTNLIYAQGNYRYHGAVGSGIDDRNMRPTDRASILTALEDHGILYVKDRAPVLIYECGVHEDIRDTDNVWFNNLLSIFNERGISWIAYGYTYNAPWGFRGTSTENIVIERANDPQPPLNIIE